METEVDILIIGGGIVGLMCAYKLKKSYPKLEVVLVEKEQYLGDHSTGRNSCVLHSGLYYPTNSLKHIHCIEGHRQWLSLSKKLDIPINLCGKYIITNKANDSELDKLYKQSIANNVKNIHYVDSKRIALLKEDLYIEEAIFSKNTGIIDIGDALKKLRYRFEADRGIILISHQMIDLEIKSKHFKATIKNEENTFKVRSEVLVNASGLEAINVRKKLNLDDINNYYIKGNYLKVSPDPKFKNLIYPIPDKDLSNLGIHSTIDFEGRNRFGPSYHLCDDIDYSMENSCIEEIFKSISSNFKNIEMGMLSLDYCGIRPKVVDQNGLIKKDFIFNTKEFHKIDNYYEFLGIESPGLTAAPSLADLLVQSL